MLQYTANSTNLDTLLVLREAVWSARLEGSQVSLTDVVKFETRQKAAMADLEEIQGIIAYREALDFAMKYNGERFSNLSMIREIHRILLKHKKEEKLNPGEFRRTQNSMIQTGSSTAFSDFIPPDPVQLVFALSNWEKYLHVEEKDRLVQLAIVSAQFELIQPFLAGNGCLARILIPLFLFDQKILCRPIFSLNFYLTRNREVYYAKLRAVSEQGDWNGWIAFFLQAVIEQAKESLERVEKLQSLYLEMKEVIHRLTHSQYAPQTMDALFRYPIFDRHFFSQLTHIPLPTASRLLNAIKNDNLIQTGPARHRGGRKRLIYSFPRLLTLFEGSPDGGKQSF
jgi:Fic family protein